jgi:predicted Na+-dependent transporter
VPLKRALLEPRTLTSPNPQLTPQDFKRVLTSPGRITIGFALQYTIMPLMGVLVTRLAGLPLAYTIG